MPFRIHLLLLVLSLTGASACTTSEASSDSRQEIIFDDRTEQEKQQQSDEIIITDTDINRQALENLSAEKIPDAQTIIADDKSKITTTFDGYGNKTEARCFVDHPRLDCVVVMTPANGKKQTLVYPVGSGAKTLPEDAVEKALTASANELANLVGASETRDDIAKKSVSPYGGKNNSANLSPLPSSAFPIMPKQIPQTPVQETSAQTEEYQTPVKEDLNQDLDLEN